MKRRLYLLTVIAFFFALPTAYAQEYGKIRALKQRAASVINQKNAFVARVLITYAIPYEQNEQGAVVRINRDGRWLDVASIEVIPVFKKGSDKEVAAHEILFYTADGILDLVSDLTIR